MESPVCTPTGSTFSMPQIVIALSVPSRITSNSISLYPLTDFSTSTWCTGERLNALMAISSSSFSSLAKPPPVPPSVNAGLRTTGYPMSSAAFLASSMLYVISLGMTGSPIDWHISLKSSLSSALSMDSLGVPRSLTRHSSRTPFFSSCIARLSPVCPPIPGTIASGLSYLRIFAIYSSVRGSIYTLSAIVVSVMIVAGLELHRITSYPSSLSARHACVPA